jgi:hypothetical protein
MYTHTLKPKEKPTVECLIEVFSAEVFKATMHNVPGELFSFMAIYPEADSGRAQEHPLLAFSLGNFSDPETLYLHEARQEPDLEDFKVIMDKGYKDQMVNGTYKIIHNTLLLEGATLLPTMWQFKQKWDHCTGVIKKHKARICLKITLTPNKPKGLTSGKNMYLLPPGTQSGCS